MGLAPDEVAYVSLTGKASEVLRKKDNPNATTAHKLLYYFHKVHFQFQLLTHLLI